MKMTMQSFTNKQTNNEAAMMNSTRPSPLGAPARPLNQLRGALGNQAFGHVIQAKLQISQPGDEYEREADRVAEQVTRMPDQATPAVVRPEGPSQISGLQRKCEQCEEEQIQRQPMDEEMEEEQIQRQPMDEKMEEEEASLQTKEAAGQTPQVTPAMQAQIDGLRGGGQPLSEPMRAFFEPRFGHDFSRVRVHTDQPAERSARAVNAQAYTTGSHIVFGAGYYSPETLDGRRLLAHELTHVVQQGASPMSTAVMQRTPMYTGAEADIVAEREYGDNGAPKAQKCGRPSWCPPGFCEPHRSEDLAKYYRGKNSLWIMAGIHAAVDSRVVPLWKEYLSGGSDPKNLTADFAKDFTNSPTTKKATTFLTDELKKKFMATPPTVSVKSTQDLDALIPTATAALNNPLDPNRMNFSFPRDIPGNLAGDIATDQTACPAGAKPSPFNDERKARGTVDVTRKSATEVVVTPNIAYTVKDTVDLCPGNCGTKLEQVATVPLSQFEATGISGDVPFTVEFPAPALGSFTISATAPTVTPLPSP
jgi:Domain of unknown function (DUF4157)